MTDTLKTVLLEHCCGDVAGIIIDFKTSMEEEHARIRERMRIRAERMRIRAAEIVVIQRLRSIASEAIAGLQAELQRIESQRLQSSDA